MSHSYLELFYHLTWSTKYRQPMITDNIKPVLLGFLKTKALTLGCEIWALNCVSDHVHLLLSIPAKLAVSEAIMDLRDPVHVK
ncbi:MAG TPA: transposase [Bacillota bacterium]|nr:transposase [Bacillota bacterium]